MKLSKNFSGNTTNCCNSYQERKKFEVTKPLRLTYFEEPKKKKVNFSNNPNYTHFDLNASSSILFEDWPDETEVKAFNLLCENESKLFEDNAFNSIDLNMLFNDEFNVIHWRRPKEFMPCNLVMCELLKKKNLNISPKVIIDLINSDSYGRKYYSTRHITTSLDNNVELNSFLSENMMTLTRITKVELPTFVIDTTINSLSKANQDRIITKESPERKLSKERRLRFDTKNGIIDISNKISQQGDLKKPDQVDFLPGNLSVKHWACSFTIWVSSVLQLIIDENLRDVYDNSYIWSKIYPQDKYGIPVQSSSGRYWIKLYWFGKAKKVEIDDRMPCTEFEEFIFPRCTRLEEMWPFLLTKAIVKLFSYKLKQNSFITDKIGEGGILYSLLGYVTQRYDIETNYINICKILPFLLQENPSNNNKILFCFNSRQNTDNERKNQNEFEKGLQADRLRHLSTVTVSIADKSDKQRSSNLFQPSSPIKLRTQLSIKSGIQKIQKQNEEKKHFENDLESHNSDEDSKIMINPNTCNLKKQVPKAINKMKINIALLKKGSSLLVSNVRTKSYFSRRNNVYIGNNALACFAYLISDFFHCHDFNMDRLNSLEFREISSITTSTDTPYKQMSKDEKRNYLMELVEIKNKQKQLRLAKIKMLCNPGKRRSYIKVWSEAIGLSELNNYGEFKFSPNQIEMAKYCVKHNSKFPPISYYESLINSNFEDECSGEDDNSPLLKAKNISDIEALVENENFSPKIKQKLKLQSEVSGVKSKQNSLLETQDESKVFKLKRMVTVQNNIPHSSMLKSSLKRRTVISLKSSNIGLTNTLSDSFKEDKARSNSIKHVYNLMLTQTGIVTSKHILQCNASRLSAEMRQGEWLNFSKFMTLFNKLCIITNPNDFSFKLTLDMRLVIPSLQSQSEKDEDIIMPNHDIPQFSLDKNQSVIHLFSSGLLSNSKKFNSKLNSSFKSVLLIFESTFSSFSNRNSLLNITIVTPKDPKFCVVHTFRNFYDSFEYDQLVEDDYFIILDSCFCPSGFQLTVNSDMEIHQLSYLDYLREFKSFRSNTKSVEVPFIPKGSYYVLMKFRIIIEETKRTSEKASYAKPNEETLNSMDSVNCGLFQHPGTKYFNTDISDESQRSSIFKKTRNIKTNNAQANDANDVENYDEGFLIKFLLGDSNKLINEHIDIFLSSSSKSQGKEKMDEHESVIKVMNYEMFDILEPCDVCICIKSPEPITKQLATFEILGNNDFNIEYMDITEAFEIQDSSYLIKNCTVFKERMSVPYSVNLSLNLKFFKSASDDLKAKDLSKFHISEICSDVRQLLEENMLLKLELRDESNSICAWSFTNEINIHNICLAFPEGDKKRRSTIHTTGYKARSTEQTPNIKVYWLVCTAYCVDDSMFNDLRSKLDNSFWIMKFFTSGPIAIHKDITKFDKDLQEVQSWSIKEPNRAERAKCSRIQFLDKLDIKSKSLFNPNIIVQSSRFNTIGASPHHNISISSTLPTKMLTSFINPEQFEQANYSNSNSSKLSIIVNSDPSKKKQSINSSLGKTLLNPHHLPKISYLSSSIIGNSNISISERLITDTSASQPPYLNILNINLEAPRLNKSYISDIKQKVSIGVKEFETKIQTDTKKLEEQYNKTRLNISQHYKSIFNKRGKKNTKSQSLYDLRADISRSQGESLNKLNLLFSCVQNLTPLREERKMESMLSIKSLIREKSNSGPIAYFLELADIRNFIESYDECVRNIDLDQFGAEFREATYLKIKSCLRLIIDAIINHIKSQFDKLKIEQNQLRPNPNKSNEIKKELRQLMELIEAHSINLDRCYIEAVLNVANS